MASLFHFKETKNYWIGICSISMSISIFCADEYFTITSFGQITGLFVGLIVFPLIVYSIFIFSYWVLKIKTTIAELKWTYAILWLLIAFAGMWGRYSDRKTAEDSVEDSVVILDSYKKQIIFACAETLKQYKSLENFENLDNYCECYYYRIKETFNVEQLIDMMKNLSQDGFRDAIIKNVKMELCYPLMKMNFYEKNVVKMEKYAGVFIVPIEINGVKKYFILDTGASWIAISRDEAESLYAAGKLSESDIAGSQKYEIADGKIAEGVKIILKSVKIGNSTIKNVEAIVTAKVNAPLLMGQSALERFGTISIDYNNQTLTLEK